MSNKKNSISRTAQWLMAVMIAVLIMGLSGIAWGQTPLPTYTPINQPVVAFNTTTNTNTSFSFEEKVIFNLPTITTINSTIRSTQIIGRISGGTLLYNQTFPVAFNSPIAQAGVTSARAAITTAGGPGVFIGQPILTGSSSTTATNSTTRYSLAGTSLELLFEDQIGPGQTQIGTRSICTGISSLPSTTAPTCSAVAPVAQFTAPSPSRQGQGPNRAGTVFNINFRIDGDLASDGAVIPARSHLITFIDSTPVLMTNLPGVINANHNFVTTYNIDQTTATTNITTLFEQYTITGVVRRIGSVHALTTEAGGDATSLFAQRLRGVGDGELKRGVWFSGYGWFGKRGSNGEIAGDNRHGKGISGGFATSLGKGFRGGVGFDHGTTKLTLDTVGESGTVDLTQFGGHLDYERGGFRLRFANANGWGNVKTVTAPTDLNFATNARYNLTTTSFSGEASYAVSLGKWNLTPNSGVEWRRVKNDSFSEAGTFGLAAAAHTTNWTRGWAGMALERQLGDEGLFKVYGRATFNGNDRVLMPVTFATLGGGTMHLESPDYGNIGSEFGASVLFPVSKHAFLYAAYDARIRGNLALNSVTGGFKLVF